MPISDRFNRLDLADWFIEFLKLRIVCTQREEVKNIYSKAIIQTEIIKKRIIIKR